MFSSKEDVDCHVKELSSEIANENDENAGISFSIAQWYYKVGDYQSAKNYTSKFLELRSDSASAHELMGKILYALGQNEAALAALAEFKISLESCRQDDLLLKACELLADKNVKADATEIYYWFGKAQNRLSNHPIVSKLKKKLVKEHADFAKDIIGLSPDCSETNSSLEGLDTQIRELMINFCEIAKQTSELDGLKINVEETKAAFHKELEGIKNELQLLKFQKCSKCEHTDRESQKDKGLAHPNFTFKGSGSTVFGDLTNSQKQRNSTNQNSVTEKKGVNGEWSSNPSFRPLAPLQTAVIINAPTGEEDEQKVFGGRAKLYRFTSGTSEWKERGVGEMKILKHRFTGKYRLVLRREQVHKVVCNTLLTPKTKLKALAGSKMAWTWAAMNYVEDSATMEIFCVSFRSPIVALAFKDAIDLAQYDMIRRKKRSTRCR